MARRRVVGNEPKGDVGEYSTISIENIICNNGRVIKDFTKNGNLVCNYTGLESVNKRLSRLSLGYIISSVLISALYSPLHKPPQTNSLTSRICRDCSEGISVGAHPQNNNLELREKTLKHDLLFLLSSN